MLLLNTVYGLVMSIAIWFAVWMMGGKVTVEWLLLTWAVASVAATINDVIQHQLIKFFNRNNTVTRDIYR